MNHRDPHWHCLDCRPRSLGHVLCVSVLAPDDSEMAFLGRCYSLIPHVQFVHCALREFPT